LHDARVRFIHIFLDGFCGLTLIEHQVIKCRDRLFVLLKFIRHPFHTSHYPKRAAAQISGSLDVSRVFHFRSDSLLSFDCFYIFCRIEHNLLVCRFPEVRRQQRRAYSIGQVGQARWRRLSYEIKNGYFFNWGSLKPSHLALSSERQKPTYPARVSMRARCGLAPISAAWSAATYLKV
jgi:hypothetical protein